MYLRVRAGGTFLAIVSLYTFRALVRVHLYMLLSFCLFRRAVKATLAFARRGDRISQLTRSSVVRAFKQLNLFDCRVDHYHAGLQRCALRQKVTCGPLWEFSSQLDHSSPTQRSSHNLVLHGKAAHHCLGHIAREDNVASVTQDAGSSAMAVPLCL